MSAELETMKAVVHWGGREPPTTCSVEIRGHGQNRAVIRRPATVFMLKFEKKWFRIYAAKPTGDQANYYANVDGERRVVILQNVSKKVLAY